MTRSNQKSQVKAESKQK